jgi:gamma-glutamyltranspeptidase/glutathione hydrolase
MGTRLGVIGGHHQPSGNTHVLSKIIDVGCDSQEPLDMPRICCEAGAAQARKGIFQKRRRGIAERGHHLVDSVGLLDSGQEILG